MPKVKDTPCIFYIDVFNVLVSLKLCSWIILYIIVIGLVNKWFTVPYLLGVNTIINSLTHYLVEVCFEISETPVLVQCQTEGALVVSDISRTVSLVIVAAVAGSHPTSLTQLLCASLVWRYHIIAYYGSVMFPTQRSPSKASISNPLRIVAWSHNYFNVLERKVRGSVQKFSIEPWKKSPRQKLIRYFYTHLPFNNTFSPVNLSYPILAVHDDLHWPSKSGVWRHFFSQLLAKKIFI